jgi:peptide deformylase
MSDSPDEHAVLDSEVIEEETSEELERELDPEILERRDEALGQVRKFGDPVLKTQASVVTEFDDALRGEITRMVEIMRNGLGVGLAATQLGIMHRVLVLQAGRDAPPTALVNPKIEWVSATAEAAEEGCLSLPGIIVDVERPLHARISAFDPDGEPLTIEASGLEARVVQHEVDHLDGVLILDRTEREQRKEALRALREGGSWRPGEIADPEDAADLEDRQDGDSEA